MGDSLNRIYRLKVTIVALIAAVVGIALLVLAKLGPTLWGWGWLNALPASELGSTLTVTGLFVITWDFVDGRDRERREDKRLRRLLDESAPAFRDAVVRGFAFQNEDLQRVATPELLDDVISNSLALRLGDRSFGSELYADIRDQAIKSEERWRDLRITMDLSPDMSDGVGADRFVVTVKWEYTVIPKYRTRSFVCVPTREEYLDIARDADGFSPWLLTPQPGLDPASTDAFELVQFDVEGVSRPIRRSVRKRGQIYAVDVGQELIDAGEPVLISYTYRTLTSQNRHLIHLDLEHPTRGLDVQLNYGSCAIDKMSVLDLFATSSPTRVQRTPDEVPGRGISVSIDGWAFPRTGIAFVWTLDSEVVSRSTE